MKADSEDIRGLRQSIELLETMRDVIPNPSRRSYYDESLERLKNILREIEEDPLNEGPIRRFE